MLPQKLVTLWRKPPAESRVVGADVALHLPLCHDGFGENRAIEFVRGVCADVSAHRQKPVRDRDVLCWCHFHLISFPQE